MVVGCLILQQPLFLNVFLIFGFPEGKSDMSEEIPSCLEFIECLANDVYKIDLHKNNIPSRKGIELFVIYSIFVIRSMFFGISSCQLKPELYFK